MIRGLEHRTACHNAVFLHQISMDELHSVYCVALRLSPSGHPADFYVQTNSMVFAIPRVSSHSDQKTRVPDWSENASMTSRIVF